MTNPLNVTPEDLLAASSPLDAVVDPALQRALLEGRPLPAALRKPSGAPASRRLRRLAGTDAYEAGVGFLARYLALVVPAPAATEERFWAVETVLGPDLAYDGPQQLLRLRVHGVAVATVVEDEEGEEPLVCLALAPRPLVARVYSPEGTYLDVDGRPVPAQQAEGAAEELGGQLATDPALLTAARRAVLGLMRLGPAGAAHHERDLADAVFAAMSGTEGRLAAMPPVHA